MTFGGYPLVGLKEARELHFAEKKLLATGVNPMAERKAEAEAKQEEAKAISSRCRFFGIREQGLGGYRDLIVNTPGFSESISGTTLFDETICQRTDEGIPFFRSARPIHSASVPRMGDTPPLAPAASAGVGQGQGVFVSKHSIAIQNGRTTHEHHPHHRYRKDPYSRPR